MGTPHSSKTIAATFTRKNADGETETAHGQFIMSESVPNHVVHLFSDFASEAPHIERFFSSESEVNTYPILHAQTEEGSFTFVDLRLAGYKRNFGGGKLTRRTYQPYVVIKSEVLLEEDDLFLTHAAFRFWGRTLGRSGSIGTSRPISTTSKSYRSLGSTSRPEPWSTEASRCL